MSYQGFFFKYYQCLNLNLEKTYVQVLQIRGLDKVSLLLLIKTYVVGTQKEVSLRRFFRVPTT